MEQYFHYSQTEIQGKKGLVNLHRIQLPLKMITLLKLQMQISFQTERTCNNNRVFFVNYHHDSEERLLYYTSSDRIIENTQILTPMTDPIVFTDQQKTHRREAEGKNHFHELRVKERETFI